MIRVIVIDDHALVREVVGRLLEQEADLRVIGSFSEGNDAVRFARAVRPDVALVDIAMPSANGLDVGRRLRAVCPSTRLLMFSMHARPEYVQQALGDGASGYVLKECASAEVVAAVRAVHAGERYVSAKLSSCVTFSGPCEPLERLSAREMQVLRLIVEGNTSHEVAAHLQISSKSVDTYRSRLMTKLDVDHLPGLVKFAIRHGLTSV